MGPTVRQHLIVVVRYMTAAKIGNIWLTLYVKRMRLWCEWSSASHDLSEKGRANYALVTSRVVRAGGRYGATSGRVGYSTASAMAFASSSPKVSSRYSGE